ncbi:MAG: hypothetical protein KZQ65_12600 [Candidatus Thiodiazotropha sp. (ex Gloverina cf. vestifex)]|nr:hypothetical protein [Candidatus Thiodiazotropha sp. (ex Gloverina cf. vestifex)]
MQSHTLLSGAATVLRQNPSTMLVLTGVAETRQPPLESMRTALQHAESVATFVIKQGIPRERVSVEGNSPAIHHRSGTCKREKPGSGKRQKSNLQDCPCTFLNVKWVIAGS